MINLKGIPNRQVYGYYEKCALGTEQEKWIEALFNSNEHNDIWKLTGDFLGNPSDSVNNLVNGDLVRLSRENNMPLAWYDLKVAAYGEKPNMYGTITIGSLIRFGKQGYNNHWYILCNSDGSDIIVLNTKDIWEIINTYEKCFYESKEPKRSKEIFNETSYDWNIVKSFDNKYMKRSLGGISKLDYIPSSIIRDFYKRKYLNNK